MTLLTCEIYFSKPNHQKRNLNMEKCKRKGFEKICDRRKKRSAIILHCGRDIVGSGEGEAEGARGRRRRWRGGKHSIAFDRVWLKKLIIRSDLNQFDFRSEKREMSEMTERGQRKAEIWKDTRMWKLKFEKPFGFAESVDLREGLSSIPRKKNIDAFIHKYSCKTSTLDLLW